MPVTRLDRERNQVVMHTVGPICATTQQVAESEAFTETVAAYARLLVAHHAPVLEGLDYDLANEAQLAKFTDLLRVLANNPLDRVAGAAAAAGGSALNREALHDFVEGLYDYWRSFDRFMISHTEAAGGAGDRRPHQTFNQTMESFAVLVRGLYRDVVENITGEHPRVYRQVSAGCQVGLVAVPREWPIPAAYRPTLSAVPFIRHVVIDPPFIIDPPSNKRSGTFTEVSQNPIEGLELDHGRWLCYPAVVGPTVIFVYVNQRFIGLGSALANLFELASDGQIAAGPDAIYLFGVPSETLSSFGDPPTVFHKDAENDLFVAAVPAEDRFGYFGYLKKMVLTLHNLVMLEQGRMPYHGAFTRIALAGGQAANVLIVGDTGAGKSETLEALRELAGEEISDLRIIADDMGSLALGTDDTVLGYGTEVGAFVRLDDLAKGYAFQQLDRAIFMSPHKVNARVVVPVTTLEEVLRGYPVDVLLYANNFEWVDEDHPVIERFDTAEQALAVFRVGRAMSKGTTTATGLTSTYFVNVFGAVQRLEQHEAIAERVFAAAFRNRTFVGQLRTRLGIEGFATEGPREAAAALLRLISGLHE